MTIMLYCHKAIDAQVAFMDATGTLCGAFWPARKRHIGRPGKRRREAPRGTKRHLVESAIHKMSHIDTKVKACIPPNRPYEATTMGNS